MSTDLELSDLEASIIFALRAREEAGRTDHQVDVFYQRRQLGTAYALGFECTKLTAKRSSETGPPRLLTQYSTFSRNRLSSPHQTILNQYATPPRAKLTTQEDIQIRVIRPHVRTSSEELRLEPMLNGRKCQPATIRPGQLEKVISLKEVAEEFEADTDGGSDMGELKQLSIPPRRNDGSVVLEVYKALTRRSAPVEDLSAFYNGELYVPFNCHHSYYSADSRPSFADLLAIPPDTEEKQQPWRTYTFHLFPVPLACNPAPAAPRSNRAFGYRAFGYRQPPRPAKRTPVPKRDIMSSPIPYPARLRRTYASHLPLFSAPSSYLFPDETSSRFNATTLANDQSASVLAVPSLGTDGRSGLAAEPATDELVPFEPADPPGLQSKLIPTFKLTPPDPTITQLGHSLAPPATPLLKPDPTPTALEQAASAEPHRPPAAVDPPSPIQDSAPGLQQDYENIDLDFALIESIVLDDRAHAALVHAQVSVRDSGISEGQSQGGASAIPAAGLFRSAASVPDTLSKQKSHSGASDGPVATQNIRDDIEGIENYSSPPACPVQTGSPALDPVPSRRPRPQHRTPPRILTPLSRMAIPLLTSSSSFPPISSPPPITKRTSSYQHGRGDDAKADIDRMASPPRDRPSHQRSSAEVGLAGRSGTAPRPVKLPRHRGPPNTEGRAIGTRYAEEIEDNDRQPRQRHISHTPSTTSRPAAPAAPAGSSSTPHPPPPAESGAKQKRKRPAAVIPMWTNPLSVLDLSEDESMRKIRREERRRLRAAEEDVAKRRERDRGGRGGTSSVGPRKKEKRYSRAEPEGGWGDDRRRAAKRSKRAYGTSKEDIIDLTGDSP